MHDDTLNHISLNVIQTSLQRAQSFTCPMLILPWTVLHHDVAPQPRGLMLISILAPWGRQYNIAGISMSRPDISKVWKHASQPLCFQVHKHFMLQLACLDQFWNCNCYSYLNPHHVLAHNYGFLICSFFLLFLKELFFSRNFF